MNRQSSAWSGEKPRKASGGSKPEIHRTLPHSAEAEMGLLSSMMQQHSGLEAAAQIIPEIGPEYFHVEAHREIFTVISDHYNSGKPTHHGALTITLRERKLLKQIGGVGALADLQTFVPIAANFAYYLTMVS